MSSIATITIKGDNVEMLKDFLEELSKAYLNRELQKKNRTAINTINFIDNQLDVIKDSLMYSEQEMINFRKNTPIDVLAYKDDLESNITVYGNNNEGKTNTKENSSSIYKQILNLETDNLPFT